MRNYQFNIGYKFPSLTLEFQTGATLYKPNIITPLQLRIVDSIKTSTPNSTSIISGVGSNLVGNAVSNITSKYFDDSELGSGLGNIFSSGLSSAGNTILNNAVKGANLIDGLSKNVSSSMGGAAAGLAANYLGKGITSAMGNSNLGKFTGLAAATVGGTLGGKIATSGFKNLFKGSGSINPLGLGMQAAGAGLSAVTGPSKEYTGKYGDITLGLDTAYDIVLSGIGLVPGGLVISGIMAFNKGLSNVFGSTSGNTKLDAILGSAFMPAPVKWLNMAKARTTDTLKDLSWQGIEKTNAFMLNGFGDIRDKIETARNEAGDTYGTFSKSAYRKANRNIMFANNAWKNLLNMVYQNDYLNVRSSDMASINNQRYALMILGGFNPLTIGKHGMKILNNATNHNIGQRLLSGAALIDDKQMILSAQSGTKVVRPRTKPHGRTNLTKPSYMTEEEWKEYLEDRKQFEEHKKSIGVETNYENPYTEEELRQLAEWKAHLKEVKKQRAAKRIKSNIKGLERFNRQANLVLTAMNQQANETLFTGQEYQQAVENLRKEKIEKFHEKAKELKKGFEAALMADLAVSAAPLLLRGFRWALNKAGLLVKVPILKTSRITNTNLYNLDRPRRRPIFEKESEKNPRYISNSEIELYLDKLDNLSGVSARQMLKDAKTYWTSPERKAFNEKLKQEAKNKEYLTEENIGHPSKDGSLYTLWENSKDPAIKMEHANFEYENIPRGEYNPSTNTIMLRTNKGYLDPYTAYHEGIHAYGATWPGRALSSDTYRKAGVYPYRSVINTQNFRQAKIDVIRNKPENRLELKYGNLSFKDFYNSDPDEFVAYGLTAGKKLGVKPFQKMPSIEEALNLWQNAIEIEPYLKRNVRIDAPIEDKWSLLNGTFLNYGVPAVIGGSTAATLYNKSK